MTTVSSKTFRSGNSEAIRLPKEVAYGQDLEVTIVRSGDVLTIYPKPKLTIKEMLQKLMELPGPGEIQERDEIEIPERREL